jgi:hypothetical protein
MYNQTFKKIGEMLKGNVYASHEISDEDNDTYRINTWDSNISIVIECNKDNEGVTIIGNVLNDIVYNETYIYNDSTCWKYNVIDFKIICARVFCIAAEEYVMHEMFASLSIYNTQNTNIVPTKTN